MVRTQIYLTEHQRNELSRIAKTTGRKQSELIRQAVDQMIDQLGHHQREAVLREAAGIWRNRTDIQDFNTIRAAWDRPDS
ncbi:MAG TPA: ribbon-helix-helix domain-containing protein [Gammaproteobacteria bacterium]|nr:ribbon-helix-helix domain-containing protein [Gammaproteobacteria bacterium]